MTFYQWGHFVMLIIRNWNLISVQSWTYLFSLEQCSSTQIHKSPIWYDIPSISVGRNNQESSNQGRYPNRSTDSKEHLCRQHDYRCWHINTSRWALQRSQDPSNPKQWIFMGGLQIPLNFSAFYGLQDLVHIYFPLPAVSTYRPTMYPNKWFPIYSNC